MNSKTKKLTIIAMMAAMSYVVMTLFRIPVVLFLKYEPKDVIITIGGFLYGPLISFIISAIVSVVEMMTVSDTGLIGMIMNLIASCSFCCTAALIYKKCHTLKGAIAGLLAGTAVTTVVMLLWNYLITPLYMGFPREEVVKLLLPAFLPFNLLKGGINSAITLLLYKPVVTALRRAGFVEASGSAGKGGKNIGLILFSLLLLATCIFFVLVMMGLV